MNEAEFDFYLPAITCTVVGLIAERNGLDENTALGSFLHSRTYGVLEVEDSKLWHLSPLMLAIMYEEEAEGRFSLPGAILCRCPSISRRTSSGGTGTHTA